MPFTIARDETSCLQMAAIPVFPLWRTGGECGKACTQPLGVNPPHIWPVDFLHRFNCEPQGLALQIKRFLREPIVQLFIGRQDFLRLGVADQRQGRFETSFLRNCSLFLTQSTVNHNEWLLSALKAPEVENHRALPVRSDSDFYI